MRHSKKVQFGAKEGKVVIDIEGKRDADGGYSKSTTRGVHVYAVLNDKPFEVIEESLIQPKEAFEDITERVKEEVEKQSNILMEYMENGGKKKQPEFMDSFEGFEIDNEEEITDYNL